ncbi:MAG: hypothetical protein A3F14_00190 [Gammaproteobacteria bacterium RIFCSPHIGHO2_12_FULL_43_28]|nr:MAG: hypothetical protein A3F14_00190 [Gammaproteobacteria bacterium RIFCSPHIGHO2_12_FULL_43_28]
MTAKPLKKRIQHEAYTLVFQQLGLVALFGCIVLILHSTQSGLSVLAGGFSYGLANLLFVWLVFRYAGAQEMTQFIAAFFAGEMLKLILSAMLILIIVKTLPVSLLSVLIGLMAAIVSFWLVCMWHFTRKRSNSHL